jgi:hypothetical protein
VFVTAVGVAFLAMAPIGASAPKRLRAGGQAMQSGHPRAGTPSAWTREQRLSALRHARVWHATDIPLDRETFADASHPGPLPCRFVATSAGGTSAKFDCELASGVRVRVKYGRGPERHAEVAAARLLSALGFGADRVTMVRRLHCYGCPHFPFGTMKLVTAAGLEGLYKGMLDYDRFTEFESVSVEERFPGDSIEVDGDEGWAWFELGESVDSPTGDMRAQIDALRLLAVFLAHWDNKAENQRLVCVEKARADGSCRHAFAYIQDLGATFGPRKVDLDAWRKVPIWQDRAACLAGMQSLPYHGGTFRPARISEAGRQFLATRLQRLSDAQLTSLFRNAALDQYRPLPGRARSIEEWVRVFKARVGEIAAGAPCPAA